MKQKRSLNSDSSVKKRKIIIGCAIAFATAIGITGVVVGAVALSRKPQVYNPYTPPVSVSTSVNGENVLHAALGLPGSNSYVAFDDLGQKATGGT
ncbi:hypothetical protein FACS1894166_05880 [Bacilli bacterium]|nr:hypothetical protein FACS1894166_05880 [Bacilli bacterium]